MSSPESPGSGPEPRSSSDEAPGPAKEVRSIGATQGKNRDECKKLLKALCQMEPHELNINSKDTYLLMRSSGLKVALLAQHQGNTKKEEFEGSVRNAFRDARLVGGKLDGKDRALRELAHLGTNAVGYWEDEGIGWKFLECSKSEFNDLGRHEDIDALLNYFADSPLGPKLDSRLGSENSDLPTVDF
ncbi:hypothetical protein BU24DRAFT_415290 [Aaosphaeria arxii CBS 175.79]|uniref:Uncharacterized protein n=1 Tax=Aaosphaeria arxii CBS 175.79 TaxID=1450172 RepID=A0A6A5X7Q2_9PLEO|nr:uncharacterized protein BU24DRAFT_415290 [Aaosphaeria arxii CBS 175.79]KAF2008926.1 hypothetical protein BU24DRAFT_415290 [Aaosphaeria arxii CBS 175.79]